MNAAMHAQESFGQLCKRNRIGDHGVDLAPVQTRILAASAIVAMYHGVMLCSREDEEAVHVLLFPDDTARRSFPMAAVIVELVKRAWLIPPTLEIKP